LAWCAGVVVLMVTVGRAAASRLAGGKVIDSTRASPVGEGTDDNALPKLLSRGVLIAPVLVTILAMQAEQAALTPDAAVVRIGSLVLSVFVGLALMPVLVRMDPRVFVPGAVGAAVAVACHSMIELTGTNHQSAGWVMAVLGFGAGLMARGRVVRPMWGRVSAGAAVVVLAVWIAMSGVWTSRVWRWEALVEAAAQRASGPAMVRQYVELAKRSPAEADGYLREASVIASAALGANVPARADVLMSVTRQMIVKAAPEVITLIDQASGVVQDMGTWRETRRVRLVMGALIWPAPPNGPGRREEARGLFTAAAALPEGSAGKASVLESRRGASVASWRVTALRTVRAVVANEPADEVTRPLLASVDRELTDVLAEACRLDPYNLQFAFQRFKHAAGTGVRGPALAEIARRVIEVNDLQRLDAEVRGLTKEQLAEVMAAR